MNATVAKLIRKLSKGREKNHQRRMMKYYKHLNKYDTLSPTKVGSV